MHHHMDGGDWFWAIPMMLLWIVVLGGVIYAAVRLALVLHRKPPVGQ